MKKIKKGFADLIAELDFTKGQVKLTVCFCLLSGGIGIFTTLLDGFKTILVFGILVALWSISMFDVSYRGIEKSEFKRHEK